MIPLTGIQPTEKGFLNSNPALALRGARAPSPKIDRLNCLWFSDWPQHSGHRIGITITTITLASHLAKHSVPLSSDTTLSTESTVVALLRLKPTSELRKGFFSPLLSPSPVTCPLLSARDRKTSNGWELIQDTTTRRMWLLSTVFM